MSNDWSTQIRGSQDLFVLHLVMTSKRQSHAPHGVGAITLGVWEGRILVCSGVDGNSWRHASHLCSNSQCTQAAVPSPTPCPGKEGGGGKCPSKPTTPLSSLQNTGMYHGHWRFPLIETKQLIMTLIKDTSINTIKTNNKNEVSVSGSPLKQPCILF